MKDYKIKLATLKNKVDACNKCKYYLYLYTLVLILGRFTEGRENLSITMKKLDSLRAEISNSIDLKEFKSAEAIKKFNSIHFELVGISLYYSHDVGLIDIDKYKAVAYNLILSI